MTSPLSYTAATSPASSLGMGDRYRRTEHDEIITVGYTDDTVDGGCWIWVENALRHVFQEGERVYIVSRAPKCPCGKRYENCWNECEWPQWAEDAFAGRPVTMP